MRMREGQKVRRNKNLASWRDAMVFLSRWQPDDAAKGGGGGYLYVT